MNAAPAPAERTIPGLSPGLKARLRRLFRLLGALSPALAARLALRLFITPAGRRIGDEESQFLASAARASVPTAHGTIQAYVWAGDGPTVLLVHGWFSHAGRMRHTIAALQAQGLRVIAFDGPAHGRSGGRVADLHAFRDTLAVVNARFGPAGAVLAHSFGALATAAWLAEAAPPELRAAVLIGMPQDIGYLFESFTLMLELPARVIARMRALFRARYGQYPEFFEAGTLAARIHLPVLLVHGDADEFIPVTHASAVHGHFARAELLIAPGLRHSAPLANAATLEQISGFLLRHLSGSAP